jgi:hypothetical protein
MIIPLRLRPLMEGADRRRRLCSVSIHPGGGTQLSCDKAAGHPEPFSECSFTRVTTPKEA